METNFPVAQDLWSLCTVLIEEVNQISFKSDYLQEVAKVKSER